VTRSTASLSTRRLATRRLGWHFLAANRRLRFGDGRLVEVGKTLTVDCEAILCEQGLHAGHTVYDALQYAQGPILCRVRLGGIIVRGEYKNVATERTVLKMADVSSVLHEFSCRCAEDALALTDKPDPRSVAAIETKRRWLRGEASDSELDAAWAAARDAMDAARTAWAAKDAAWDARDAAWAAKDAARAAMDAAWAARDAAWDAAWAAQKRRLASMLRNVEWET